MGLRSADIRGHVVIRRTSRVLSLCVYHLVQHACILGRDIMMSTSTPAFSFIVALPAPNKFSSHVVFESSSHIVFESSSRVVFESSSHVVSGLLYTGQRKHSVYTRERTQRRPTCITVMGENFKCTIYL